MDLEEIRSSGLLELYAMGQLSTAEQAEVEAYLEKYPPLRDELREIERSLELYAGSAAVKAPAHVKGRILDAIKSDASTHVVTRVPSSGLWPAIAAIFGLGVLLLGYLFYQKDQQSQQMQNQIIAIRDTCSTTTTQLTQEVNLYRQLTFPENKILPFQPTPGFAQTDLYLHHNKATKKNFIQVRNLPDIAANQTFQLWSIKTDQSPAPLNVFDVPENGLVEVNYVEGTEVYAITIEPDGGSTAPTLQHLIGTVSVTGI